MNTPRIVFMGTPDFAVASLSALIDNDYNVVAVITAPDKPAGRGRKINESAVKKYAVSKNIPVLQPEKLRDENFLEELRSYEADLQIVVAFRMLPKLVWDMPKMGTFNLHASLLPQYRGAAPINWAVINGESKTGITTFLLDENIDEGNILLQKEVEININDNVGIVHDNLMNAGNDLVLKTVDGLANGTISPKKQNESLELKPAPKIFKDDCRINWKNNALTIHNFIRGLSPYPGTWTKIFNDGKEVEAKIISALFVVEEHNLEVGVIIAEKKKISVAVSDGFIEIKEIQISGKKRMRTIDLLNGYSFSEDSKVI
ncbi:MAG: methionyl-tRNA formyltransferase [Ichthyobacteriaceae bacterium]|nr:methionyl-tRNA formyltransferase [Ichthyobacteriaceae bacterium]